MTITIATTVHAHARAMPDAPAMLFLERGERPGDADTYGTLDMAARRVGARLLDAGLRGRAVLLACDSGLAFVRAFLGCLYAGVYAVPVPAMQRRARGQRQRLIAQSAKPAAVIVDSDTAETADLPLLAVSDLLAEAQPALAAPEPVTTDGIAFIQYSSGSTTAPKGIVVTHGNIMANQAMIRTAFAHGPRTVVMSWLPLHHDMGLIGSILQPLYLGGRCILMSPLSFLQRPVRWLRAIAAHKATTSGAPNFAYELCARHIPPEHTDGLDLSSWTLAFCGSEPVRPGSMRRFAQRFGPNGFDPGSLYPCYGMAEATLFVTGGTAGTGARSHDLERARFAEVSADGSGIQAVTDCGRPVPPARIAIVAADGEHALAAPAIGEICVAGPHVSPGLWAPDLPGGVRPYDDRTVSVDGVPYLRSGDAGAVVDGGLHVVGRLKDMVIVRGVNVHAEDIEHTLLEQPEAEDIAAAAAIAVEREASEALVILCELSAKGPRNGLPLAVAETLRQRVADAHGLSPAEMVLLAPRSLPRTTSGKIQRGAARAAWLDGRLTPSRWRLAP